MPPDKDGNIPQQWGTAQNIPDGDAKWILAHNRFPSYKKDGFQYDGHHIKSVENCIETGDYLKIIDPDNIIIGTRGQHFDEWHNRDYRVRTEYVLGPNNKKIYSIDRNSINNSLNNLT